MSAKVDLSGRAFTDAPPPRKNLIKRALIGATGFPYDWAVKNGTATEIRALHTVGTACCLYFLLWWASVLNVLHVIFDFDGRFNVVLIPIALLIASTQAVTDHITQIKPAIRAKGQALLAAVGYKLPPTDDYSRSARIVRSARPVQGVSFAVLTVVFGLLTAESPGTHQITWADFQTGNPTTFVEAERVEIEKDSRDKAAYAVPTDQVNNLTRVIASIVRKDATVSRKSAEVDPRLDQLQKQLDAAKIEQARLRAVIDQDDADHNGNIEKRVLSSPRAIPRRTDLAAQLNALWQLISDNPLMWGVTTAMVIVGCSLELGFMWVGASYPSAPLCGRLVLDDYEQLTKLAKEGGDRLDIRPDERVNDPPPHDRPPLQPGAAARKPSPQPPHDPEPPPAPTMNLNGSHAANDDTSPISAMANGQAHVRRGPGRPKGSTSKRTPTPPVEAGNA
jgi:hypothetical protein